MIYTVFLASMSGKSTKVQTKTETFQKIHRIGRDLYGYHKQSGIPKQVRHVGVGRHATPSIKQSNNPRGLPSSLTARHCTSQPKGPANAFAYWATTMTTTHRMRYTSSSSQSCATTRCGASWARARQSSTDGTWIHCGQRACYLNASVQGDAGARTAPLPRHDHWLWAADPGRRILRPPTR